MNVFTTLSFIAILALCCLNTACRPATNLEEAEVHGWSERNQAYKSSASEPWIPQKKIDAKAPNADLFSWMRPTTYTDFGGFWAYKSHEGVDYINTKRNANGGALDVPVVAAADGVVVYIRIGCPQSSEYGSNLLSPYKMCAGGWGNHVVIKHTKGNATLYTRYAHLKPGGIVVNVGDKVVQGQKIALMGNSGSSSVKHLHFEIGVRAQPFDKTKPSQNFDAVYNPEKLTYKPFALVK